VTLNPDFKVTVLTTFHNRMSQNCAFHIVQLQIIRLLNLQYNVPLKCSPSAIAEPLVSSIYDKQLF